MEKKICFIIMGFGKKMDYRNSVEIDLDKTYNEIIKKLFLEDSDLKSYDLIRADEINKSGLIDIDMYTLLLTADLVIADITTLNENAIYELGIRHATKPFSTIIMMQNNETNYIPFDLSHCRVLTYNNIELLDKALKDKTVDKYKSDLKSYIIESQKEIVDSPLYRYLSDINPPKLKQEKIKKLLKDDNTINSLMTKAKKYMDATEFDEAIILWGKLKEQLPNNDYVIQQYTISIYKSKKPNQTEALQKALREIYLLNPEKSLDIETIGITGAIYKRLFNLNQNEDYLDLAIEFYHKGYMIQKDYYNGQNYADCLFRKMKNNSLTLEEKIYFKMERDKTYLKLIEILTEKIERNEIDGWGYTTLATCYFCLGDDKNYKRLKKIIKELDLDEFIIKSFEENIKDMQLLLS